MMDALGDLLHAHLDRLKESFLWAASKGGRVEECAHLLEMGADVNWRHESGDTALLAAVKAGHVDVVELLVQSDADVNLPSATGKSALRICMEKGEVEMADVLLSYGAKPANVDLYSMRLPTKESALLPQSEPSPEASLKETAQEPRREGKEHRADAGKREREWRAPQKLPSLVVAKESKGTADVSKDLLKQVYTLHQTVLEERAAKTAAERKFKDVHLECSRVVSENFALLQQNESLSGRIKASDTELQRLRKCVGDNLNDLNLPEVRKLESEVRKNLERISDRRRDLEQMERSRHAKVDNLCVVCMSSTKNVLLLPCRHLCVCTECSKRPELAQQGCPLCRSAIVELMDVYA